MRGAEPLGAWRSFRRSRLDGYAKERSESLANYQALRDRS
jgi:hypothetical protein